MQTRKDLYQAHRLMQQRLGMALLQAEPDVPESPMRRQNIAMFCGILLAVLVMAVFGIWGLVKPGGATKLTEAGQLLVEEESGALYVYSQQERKLLPVSNYVSARLLLDAAEIKVRNVSAASLDDFARGPLVGIPGAPNSLPKRDKLVKAPWSVCVVEGDDPSVGRRAYTTLVGGTELGGTPVGEGAMVVNDGHQNWVIWADRRMKVSPAGVRTLGVQPRKVPPAWLNAIPPGRDFAAPPVPRRGQKVRGSDGKVAAVVGQVFTVPPLPGGEARWYVLLADGFAPISETQARLLLEDSASKRAYGTRKVLPITTDAASVNASPSAQRPIENNGMPATMPKVINPPLSAPLCAVYADTLKGSVSARLTTGSRVPLAPPKTPADPEHFDQVLLPHGSAAVAGLLPGEKQLGSVTQFFLITDQGRRFPLQSGAQLATFGYEATDVAPIPSSILHLIPEGPKLDPAAALKPVALN
ncbi:type VII secretion protein EccB [Nonomuraea africana]|uniref:Type VII secretion protein EccB n=1 Tax=Nonomuraea africana TaxID=46171 RepID=A0ABR9KUB1_9ACTN|nr:type VII secretion protein EccB [Nonomuraea africana]MBE1565628.1 type VII secretion protein EccB [Nonomuraea africana]